MLIKNTDSIQAQQMTMPGADGVHMRLLLGRSDGVPNFAMRLFEISPGGNTPLHEHNYEHEVLVLEGEGEVLGVGGITPVRKGMVVYVPANERHQFKNTGERPLKFICLVPTQYDCAAGCAPTPGS